MGDLEAARNDITISKIIQNVTGQCAEIVIKIMMHARRNALTVSILPGGWPLRAKDLTILALGGIWFFIIEAFLGPIVETYTLLFVGLLFWSLLGSWPRAIIIIYTVLDLARVSMALPYQMGATGPWFYAVALATFLSAGTWIGFTGLMAWLGLRSVG